MPVVNTANFVDRLRDFTRRIAGRPSLQNVSKRWHTVYESLAVGSPQQVQEFYKYIKVYKQCPANDLLFMNMTVQLARASMFPTRSMFKQMFKFEKHMDGLILAEGFHGIYGSRGIEILCGHNDHLLKSYRRFKRHSETKRADREMKTARKNAKQMAALREVRAKSRGLYEIPVYSYEALVPGEGPIPARAPKVLDTTPKMTSEILSPEAQDIVVKELSEVKKYCEILKAQMEEAEKRREEDDVANKLNEVVEKLISTSNDSAPNHEEKQDVDDEKDNDVDEENDENLEEEEEDNEEEEESGETSEEHGSSTPLLPDFQACNLTEQQKKAIMRILMGITEDSDDKQEVVEVTVTEEKTEESSDDEEEIEKIDEKDVDAMEYEML